MKKVIFCLLLGTLFFTSTAFAVPVKEDAVANEEFADDLRVGPKPGDPTAEEDWINTFLVGEDPPEFEFYKKFEYNGFTNPTELSVTTSDDPPYSFETYSYLYKYDLTIPDGMANTVDLVLGVKQGKGFVAYLFEQVAVGVGTSREISGFFKGLPGGFMTNGENNNSFGYSHISIFLRDFVEGQPPWEEPPPVPEPSTLLLMGAGIAGLAFYRRKKK